MKFYKRKPIRYMKSRAQRDALRRLSSFLDQNNPRVVRFLVRMWDDQEAAITYKELREAILRGYMDEVTLEAWQHDYAVFFNTFLKDVLITSCTAGGKDIAETLLRGTDAYTPMLTGIDRWVDTHGAEFITLMSDEAKEAVSTMVRYTATGNMTVDELSRIIRPTIGLTARQSVANAHHYERVKEHVKSSLLNTNPKMSEATAERQAAKRAKDSALRYAARQHRQRAMTIAQTELSFAYNKGADDAVRGAMREGLLPRMQRQWCTSGDDRVCPICAALDGTIIEMDDDFPFPGRLLYEGQHETPPAHPGCGCAVCYVEAEE